MINRSSPERLQAAGILTHHDAFPLIILDPPSARAGGGWLSGPILANLVDVCWYGRRCWLAIRFVRPQIVHPLLTGVYLSLPALLLHPRSRVVMSAYSYQFVSHRDRRLFGVHLGANDIQTVRHAAQRTG